MFSFAGGYLIEGLKVEDTRWNDSTGSTSSSSSSTSSSISSSISSSVSAPVPSSSFSSSSGSVSTSASVASSSSTSSTSSSSSSSPSSPSSATPTQLYEWSSCYKKHFQNTTHRNFIVYTKGEAVVVSLRNDNTHFHLLIRSKEGPEHCKISKQQLSSSLWRRVLGLNPGPLDIYNLVRPSAQATRVYALSGSPAITQEICHLDEPAPRPEGVQIGVVYCKADQTSENEFFSNVEVSEGFEEFLQLLGERIDLLNWSSYAGGLDTSKGRSGTHSVYTRWQDTHIMFHVSTLLPLYKKDPQQLERKKHIGNDRVVIIFKDGNEPLPPDCIHSKSNHIMILVQICPEEEAKKLLASTSASSSATKTFYRVSVARKESVPQFEPYLPDPPIFPANQEFRDFLLTKCVSGLGATHFSSEFKALRQLYYSTEISKFVKKNGDGPTNGKK